MKILRLFACTLGLALVATALAQNRTPPPTSPEVHPDRTVTFRVRAPDAQKVELSAQFLKANQIMQKDAAGLWSVTVGPVEPNLYPYNFVVDGVGVADAANPDLFPNERFKSSLVDIPAATLSLTVSRFRCEACASSHFAKLQYSIAERPASLTVMKTCQCPS